MKKKLLATALAAALALTNVPTVFAVEKGEAITGDLTVTTFFNEKTDAVEMKDGDSYTIKFHNKSNGTNNWENFILAVTGAIGEAYTSSEQEVLCIRSDSWGWGGGMSDFVLPNAEEGNKLVFNSNINFDNFAAETQAGIDVEITIGKDGNKITYDAKIGQYTTKLEATSGKDLPESLYVFLTGENCTLTGITTTKSGAGTNPPEEPDDPVTPEDPDILKIGAFNSAKTESLPLKDGDSYTYKFHNKSVGTNNWDNYILAMATADAEPKNVLFVRADNFAFLNDFSPFTNALAFESNIDDFAVWAEAARAGFDVEVTISRSVNTLKYEAKMGESYTSALTVTAVNDLPETINVFLTGENCELSGITVTKGTTDVIEPIAPPEPDVEVPEGSELIGNGSLEVTAFFGNKTEPKEFKSGESYTFNFHNKSNGTNNWENYVMAITGATGDDYTGAEQEILVIRADAWGWGGGMSDFVAPDGDDNYLVFDTNITDWAAWAARAQAGYDVEVTISRDGNTLAYEAYMSSGAAREADYYVKLRATSGKALPESTYVFLTGENVSLSNMIGTRGDGVRLEEFTPPKKTKPVDNSSFIFPATPAEKAEANSTNTISGDLKVTTFFAEKTEAVVLGNGGSYTFKFKNKSFGSNNWENFIMAVTGAIGDAYTGADQEVLIVRADNWGWGGGMSDFVAPDQAGNALVFESNIDWEKWQMGAQAGYDVEITISRNGNTLTYDAKIGDYYVKLTATSGKALPANTYVFFTGEKCELTGITTVSGNPGEATVTPAEETTAAEETKAPEETTANTETTAPAELPTISGDLTVTTFFNERTNAVELRDGGSYTFKFNSKSNGTNNWENFIMAVTGATGAAYTGADQEILIVRADNWGWGGGMSDFVAPDQEGNALAFESDINWDNWLAGAQAGYDVEITISRNGNTLVYDAKIGDYFVKLNATSGKALPESAYVFFTGENCVLSGITTINNNPSVLEDTTSAPQDTNTPIDTTTAAETTAPTETTAAPAAPVSLGDLTVTSFFNEKTSPIELKSGDSYSFKFNNRSTGTNNWDNFILAIAGETGAAYTGADQEVLILRADNWGWGGGYSDFVAPDQAGNALAFESNIDWDNWVAGAQAGYDVNITLTRFGNTLIYNATIGDYYVKLTATSGKALPKTLYVFLTGENCVLSGITARSLSDTAPNTGSMTSCTIAVFAIASAAAAVVLKRKYSKK